MVYAVLDRPRASARAAAWPVATIKITFRASITVATPTVNASLGTFSESLSKKRELAMRVSCVSVLMRVREASDDPGSLNAICPSGPIPPRNRSMPPAALIFSS